KGSPLFFIQVSDGFGGLFTNVDVVGHEISHGLVDATAGLGSAGEPGALNEGTADIFGLMIRYFPGTPPLGAANAWISSLARRFARPGADGSFDYWFSGIGGGDPHRVSGVVRHFFWYLVNGASACPGVPCSVVRCIRNPPPQCDCASGVTCTFVGNGSLCP